MMKRLFSISLLLLLACAAQAQTAPASNELTRLLNEFLAGASKNEAAVHDRFWADDLVYTGSGGRRRSKADVMHDVRSAPAPKPGDPATIYSAEDVRIQQYGQTAIVAFRLVGTTVRDGASQVAYFFNTGTFVNRNDKWQVVAWQATRIPKATADVEKEVATQEAAFHAAMRTSDVKSLESLSDETFVWTQDDGTQVTRKQLIEQLAAGRLKYTKLETQNGKTVAYGDTAIVRGVTLRQRAAVPGSNTGADAQAFIAYYTLTFINTANGWKAVAMHTSRAN
jgi:ketosteroid isomerase-like protein